MRGSDDSEVSKKLVVYVVLYSVFFILIVTVSVFIFRILYKAKQRAKVLRNSSSDENITTALNIILAILCFSVFTMVANVIIMLFELKVLDRYFSHESCAVFHIIEPLFYINNVVNMFVHLLNKRFRNNLKCILSSLITVY